MLVIGPEDAVRSGLTNLSVKPMANGKLAVQRLSDTIAHELERRILDGALKPGDRLQPERELAVELGVSRPSLREAIQKLVSKGLLHSRQGGGTYVTDRLDAGFIDPWQEMLRQHPNIQGDLLEFRGMLECEAASLAARRATDADLTRLTQAFEAMNQAFDADDLERRASTDIDFHQAIGEATHNALIGHRSDICARNRDGFTQFVNLDDIGNEFGLTADSNDSTYSCQSNQ